MRHEKLIISAALTGAATNRSHCPYIPFTPKELGEESKRAVDAGASIVHIHAREDDQGLFSYIETVFEVTGQKKKTPKEFCCFPNICYLPEISKHLD